MINVTARFAIKPDHNAQFESAVAAAREVFLADPGCLRFDLQRVAKEDGSYVLLEAYDSKDALGRHGKMPEFAAFSTQIAELAVTQPEITVLLPVGEQTSLTS